LKKFRGIFLKNDYEIGLLREANRIVALILQKLGEHLKPGIKTIELEELAIDLCHKYRVKPAFKGYHGYPYALCCSVNEQIVHSFPSQRRLEEGDIISIDMGVIYQGFYGDSAVTFPVGQITPEALRLLEVTEESLYRGIAEAKVGNDLYDISRAIQTYVEENGYHVIKRFVGHGIGTKLHEKPEVPNFVPKRDLRLPLKKGMVLAIEPMVAVGTDQVEVLSDKWTAITRDKSLSAHFEHTIAITKQGPLILSKL